MIYKLAEFEDVNETLAYINELVMNHYSHETSDKEKNDMRKKTKRTKVVWEYESDINCFHVTIEGHLAWAELVLCMYDILRFGMVLFSIRFSRSLVKTISYFFPYFWNKLLIEPKKEESHV